MATQTATRSGSGTGGPGGRGPATSTPVAVSPPKQSLGDRALAWINAHRRVSTWVGAVIVLAAVLLVWQLSIRRRAEEIASRDLQSARFAYENQNLPLAASELAKVVENYSGSNAAAQARLLLANVRLLQGQPQQAIDVLKDYASGAGKAYRSQSYGLLGAAYENLGRWRDAAEAYENGATAARLDFQKAQMLSDAGRAWTTAADTAKAVADYRRIVKDFSKDGNVTEAKVRLAELTRGAM
jgi:tetratricopeptide (TPR) repeat protein